MKLARRCQACKAEHLFSITRPTNRKHSPVDDELFFDLYEANGLTQPHQIQFPGVTRTDCHGALKPFETITK